MTARKSPEERRREGGSAKWGAVSHRPAPPEPEDSAQNGHDEELLAELAATRRLIAEMREIVEREGTISVGVHGQARRHPCVLTMENAMRHESRLMRRLGLAKEAERVEEDAKPLGQVLFETLGPNPRASAVDWRPS